jgi:hypothetical protein
MDIGLAAITFAHTAFANDVDVQKYSKEIGQLAAEVMALRPSRDRPNGLRAPRLQLIDDPAERCLVS